MNDHYRFHPHHFISRRHEAYGGSSLPIHQILLRDITALDKLNDARRVQDFHRTEAQRLFFTSPVASIRHARLGFSAIQETTKQLTAVLKRKIRILE